MALPAYDDFSPNENPLTTNWTTILGGQADLEAYGGFCRGTGNTSASAGAFWDADSFDDDQYSKIVAYQFSGSYGESVSLCVRAANTGGAAYLYQFTCIHDTGISQVWKQVNNSWTQIGADYASIPEEGQYIKVSVVGTTITPNINGSDLATRSDSALSTGAAGIMLLNYGYADDWEGGNVAAGGPFNVVMTII